RSGRLPLLYEGWEKRKEPPRTRRRRLPSRVRAFPQDDFEGRRRGGRGHAGRQRVQRRARAVDVRARHGALGRRRGFTGAGEDDNMSAESLGTTNVLLGIMAAVSVLDTILLVVLGVMGYRLYTQAMRAVRDLEQRQVAPLVARVNVLMNRVDAILF